MKFRAGLTLSLFKYVVNKTIRSGPVLVFLEMYYCSSTNKKQNGQCRALPHAIIIANNKKNHLLWLTYCIVYTVGKSETFFDYYIFCGT